MTTVLGVFTGHDQSACLLVGGKVVCLIEEERLTRVKNGLPKAVRNLWPDFNGMFGYFPWAALSYCLETAGLGLDDLDALVLPEDAQQTGIASLIPIKDKRKILFSTEPVGGSHHFCHALSAFFASPFERAAVLVVDGDGCLTDQGYEAETGYLFPDRSGSYRELWKNRYSPAAPLRSGLGWTYDYVSSVLGFVNTRIGYLSEPGKTMGLAPYGQASAALDKPWISRIGTKLDFNAFHEFLVTSGLHKLVSFEDREKALVQNEDAISQYAKDLAWKVQKEVEEALLGLARELYQQTGAKALCLAGGVALNSVANGLILAKGPFEQVFVQPAAADNGQAIGLAYWGHLKLAAREKLQPIPHAFGGRPYTRDQIHTLLQSSGLAFQELASDAALTEDAATELARGRIVGWFQGGSEYGPRALGHRSILADPRGQGMKDHLNARVKFREPFRPFAPSVLRERSNDVFELASESPYMLLVAPVRAAWRARVPAIAHVDATARVQTVDREVDPIYHGLIAAFDKKTDVPLVLNTSFNLRGMPVVETPRDALQCFLYTDMDALYLGRFKVSRPEPSRLFPKAAAGWRFIVENELSWNGSQLRVRFETGEKEKKRSVPVRPLPQLVTLFASLDGKRSLADAMAAAYQGERPTPELVIGTIALVQSLLRAGALTLRVGSVEL